MRSAEATGALRRDLLLPTSPRQWVLFGLSVLVLAWVLVSCAWPGLLTGADPLHGDVREKFQAPSGAHWFGTDYLGRDLYSRVVHGARASVLSALLAVGIGFVVGALVGTAAGMLRGVVEAVLMRLTDGLLAVPGFLLAMVIVVSLGFGTTSVGVAVGILSVATFSRLVRAETLRVVALPYVEAAYVLGGHRWRVLVRHVLPNVLPSAVALAVAQFGAAVLAIAGLAFLGYGNPPPAPEWGQLVAEGFQYLYAYPWMVVMPGLVVVAMTLALNHLSSFRGGRR